VHTLWFISFLLFFSLSKIAEEMTVISFIGFTSNLIGAFFFKLGDRANTGEENEG
jgi:Co/Zn/Cd efflux system component